MYVCKVLWKTAIEEKTELYPKHQALTIWYHITRHQEVAKFESEQEAEAWGEQKVLELKSTKAESPFYYVMEDTSD